MATKSPSFIVKAWNLFKSDEENIRSSYNSLKTIDLSHERVHNGRMFRHSEVHSLGTGEALNHLIIPNSGSNIHLQSMNIKSDQGIVRLGLYEDPFTNASSLGADHTDQWLNQNRSSSNVPPFIAHESPFIDANSLGANIIEDLVTDTSKDAGGTEEGLANEITLNHSKTYLLRTVNEAGAAIATVAKFAVYDAKD